jgi:hypothetical protein
MQNRFTAENAQSSQSFSDSSVVGQFRNRTNGTRETSKVTNDHEVF